MADEFPIQKILAVINWETGEVFKARRYEEKVGPHANDRRVRVKPSYDRVGEA